MSGVMPRAAHILSFKNNTCTEIQEVPPVTGSEGKEPGFGPRLFGSQSWRAVHRIPGPSLSFLPSPPAVPLIQRSQIGLSAGASGAVPLSKVTLVSGVMAGPAHFG